MSKMHLGEIKEKNKTNPGNSRINFDLLSIVPTVNGLKHYLKK